MLWLRLNHVSKNNPWAKMASISHTTFSNAFSSKCNFSTENVYILILISLKFVPKGSFVKKSALVQVMTWCPTGVKPLTQAI